MTKSYDFWSLWWAGGRATASSDGYRNPAARYLRVFQK